MPYSDTDLMIAINRYTTFNGHPELILQMVDELYNKYYDVKDFDLVSKFIEILILSCIKLKIKLELT